MRKLTPIRIVEIYWHDPRLLYTMMTFRLNRLLSEDNILTLCPSLRRLLLTAHDHESQISSIYVVIRLFLIRFRMILFSRQIFDSSWICSIIFDIGFLRHCIWSRSLRHDRDCTFLKIIFRQIFTNTSLSLGISQFDSEMQSRMQQSINEFDFFAETSIKISSVHNIPAITLSSSRRIATITSKSLHLLSALYADLYVSSRWYSTRSVFAAFTPTERDSWRSYVWSGHVSSCSTTSWLATILCPIAVHVLSPTRSRNIRMSPKNSILPLLCHWTSDFWHDTQMSSTNSSTPLSLGIFALTCQRISSSFCLDQIIFCFFPWRRAPNPNVCSTDHTGFRILLGQICWRS